jgi:hypothetical protein
MMELQAFCDESETPGKVYVVAGWWAPAIEWEKLEEPWNHAVKHYGISEFHAKDCEQGKHDFEGRSRQERTTIASEFLTLVNSIDVRGVYTAIDTRRWDRVRMKELRAKYGDPFYVAFQQTVETIAKDVEAAGYVSGEEVALVFDERPGGARIEDPANADRSGDILDYFRSMKASPNPATSFVRRLGSLTFGSSDKFPQLQAADLLAYEARRYWWRVEYDSQPERVRRNWDRLGRGRFFDEQGVFQPPDPMRLHGQHYPLARFDELMAVMERQFGAGAKERKKLQDARRAARRARGADRRAAVGNLKDSDSPGQSIDCPIPTPSGRTDSR